jgi:hypothetical protein
MKHAVDDKFGGHHQHVGSRVQGRDGLPRPAAAIDHRRDVIGAAGELAASLASVTAQTPDKVVRGLMDGVATQLSQNTAVPR